MDVIGADVLSVDFSEPKYIRLNVKQGDNGIRHFLFKCTNHGLPVLIDQNTIYAVLKLKNPMVHMSLKNVIFCRMD